MYAVPFSLRMMAVVATMAVAACLVERHWGFGLADESYLWYGAQHLLHGQVPLRDFMSYDVGRYVLAGMWMRLVGDDGILALRTLLGLVTIFSVGVACHLIARAWRLEQVWRIVPASLLFLLWMAPRNKVFDIGASIVLVAMIAHVLARPSHVRMLSLGILVGMLAILGRNHGVYALIASLIAGLWMFRRGAIRKKWPALGVLVVGVGLGYAPLLACMLLVPGFAAAMWESLRLMLDYGATNLPLPVPWPWTLLAIRPFDVGTLLAGCTFVALLVFDVTGLYIIFRRHGQQLLSPLFVAAVCVSIPYTHYAFSRANISHLSHAVMPMLIGILVGTKERCINGWRSVCLPILMLLFCSPFALRLHPRYDAWRYGGHWQPVTVGNDVLMLDPREAHTVDLLMRLRDTKHAPGPIFVAPLWPGAYSLYRQSSPTWEIYPVMPRSAVFQEQELARLQKARIGLAIILDTPLDGRDDLRYSHTHYQIYDYLQHCLVLRPDLSGDPMVKVFDGPDHCG
jgi:hypothetical protein